MSRFADNVHLTDPKDHTSVFFMKGELIPEWAFDMIGDHLIREGEGDPVKPEVQEVKTVEEEPEKTTEEDLGLDEDEDETVKTAPAEEDDEAKPYDEWTNQELRDELISRSLATGGKKGELVARLEEDDE